MRRLSRSPTRRLIQPRNASRLLVELLEARLPPGSFLGLWLGSGQETPGLSMVDASKEASRTTLDVSALAAPVDTGAEPFGQIGAYESATAFDGARGERVFLAGVGDLIDESIPPWSPAALAPPGVGIGDGLALPQSSGFEAASSSSPMSSTGKIADVSSSGAGSATGPLFDDAMLSALVGQPGTDSSIRPALKTNAVATQAGLPLTFQANVGQTDSRVRFVAEGGGYTLFLTGDEAVFSLRGSDGQARDSLGEPVATTPSVVHMRIVGANPDARPVGQEPLSGTVNYFVGNDPAKWHGGVATFGRVAYPEVYPGVNLVYYGNQGSLEYDFQVAPGADPRPIALQFQGGEGASIDAEGNLVVQTTAGALRQHKPILYQEMNGVRHEVAGAYVLRGPNQVGFTVGAYDPSRPLVIDPVLTYSTFLGGSGADNAYGLAVDSQGNTYLTGQTSSTDFPTTDGSVGDGSPHVFVAKIDATGQNLVYSTYLSGTGPRGERGNAIALDSAGNAYVTGRTSSRDFPIVAGAFQSLYPGGMFSAFVTKINPTGDGLVYSTYLGGSVNDSAFGIAVDANGNAYVAGGTSSDDFPFTPNAFQYVSKNTSPFFAEFNADGSDLLYASFLGGGRSMERANGIALDAQGNAYITGQTGADDFPTTLDAAQPDFGGGLDNAFVAKFNPNAFGDDSLVYSTYLGGNRDDRGLAIAVDADGNAYVTGEASSTNFPLRNAFQSTFRGAPYNAFVTEVNAAGTQFVSSSYFGGGGEDRGLAIALDAANNIYLTGYTTSPDFPTRNPIQPALGGGSDAFVAELSNDGSGPLFSTFLGGSGNENADGQVIPHDGGIAVDAMGTIYVLGHTGSADFPTVNPLQATLNGFTNAFLVKIA